MSEQTTETSGSEIEEGAVLKGCVRAIGAEGVLVELENGARGFIGNTRTAEGESVSADEILRIGQPIDVRVVGVNHETGGVRITLKRANRDDCKP
jgi:ribosomal protein S1